MSVVKAKALKHSGLTLPIRPFSQEELDSAAETLASNRVDYDAVEREFVFKKEVSNALSQIQQNVLTLQSQVSFQKATKRLVISSNDLSTTDSADDTITVLSETPYEFDFTDSRRFTKVVLSPGAGVKPHELRFDKIVQQGDTDYPQSVYAVSATKLQMVIWNGTTWDTLAWDSGWTVDVTQYIDGDLPIL